MGAVCSAGMVETNAELGGKSFGFSGKLKKENSFVNHGEAFSDSRSDTAQGRKQKRHDSGFSFEHGLSTPASTGRKQVSQKGSLLGKAGERAVEVLDTLGSGMPKLNTGGGFVSGMTSRGNKMSILAFEVANTITKGAILFQSLSEENIQILKKDVLQSERVQLLVSTDMKELIALAEADKRGEFDVFSREVVRFGNMCKDPQWHNLDRYFSGLDLDVLDDKQYRAEAEKTMQEFTSLVRNTAELYHELNAYERFEQDYLQKIKEMESLNLPLKGTTTTNYCKGHERLGEAGLALHYANIINQINMIASRPTALPPNMRDTLYHGLPNNIKIALPSQLQTIADMKELSITQIKAEMEKILQWLVPAATNTVKLKTPAIVYVFVFSIDIHDRAHQGFGWVGEWANTSNDFDDNTSRESNPIRLQTLYYADKRKIDVYIIELLAWLHHLISFVKSKQNTLRQMPNRSPPKVLELQSKMRQFLILSVDSGNKPLGTQISQEDRKLLEEVIARRNNPGFSKSEDLGLAKKRQVKDLHATKSAGSSPAKEIVSTRPVSNHQNYNVLDIMDGLSR
ncbi:hypothetical protein ACSQ67_018013 [Phaseolus vulgaris]